MKYLLLTLLLTSCGPSEEPYGAGLSPTEAEISKGEKLCKAYGGLVRLEKKSSGYGTTPHIEAYCKYTRIDYRVKD